MRTKTQRMSSAVVASVMLLTLLTACTTSKTGGNESTETPKTTQGISKNGIDLSKEVNLVMYLTGEAPKDFNLVLAELNKLIKKDLNATLTVNYVPIADRKTKFPLLFASGEKFDLVFTADWNLFKEQAQKGAYLGLNDLLPKFAPETFKLMPKEGWDEASLNGNIYMVPQQYQEVNPQGVAIRGDLRKKYNLPEIKSLDDFGAYLAAVKTNNSSMLPYNAGTPDINSLRAWMLYEKPWLSSAGDVTTPLFQEFENPSNVFVLYDTPEYQNFANRMWDWSAKGYWSKSLFSNPVASKDAYLSEKSASAFLNLSDFDKLYQKIMDKNPEWQPEFYPVAPNAKTAKSSYLSNGMAINKNSANPERAMMLLELLRNNEQYYMLSTYGIKGRNYELTSDGSKLTLPQGVTAIDNGFAPESASSWGWRNEKFYKYSDKTWPLYNKVKKDVESRAIVSKMQGFTFNREAVKTEMAAIDQVSKQYNTMIDWGMQDPKESIPQIRQKMKDAGIDKVLNENKTQVDAYLKK